MTWWERIDRDEAVEAARRLVPSGGCLVLLGDGLSGRHQAAALVQEALDSFGYKVLRPEVGARPATLRRMLIEVWRALAGPPRPDEVPPWVAGAARLSCQALVAEIRIVVRAEEKTALLLEDPDSLEGLRPQDVYTLGDLAHQVGWPVVVTSDAASKTDWSGLHQPANVLPLRDFSESDVRQCLVRAPELADLEPSDLEEAVAAVMAGCDDAVRPTDAYTVLRAWSSQ